MVLFGKRYILIKCRFSCGLHHTNADFAKFKSAETCPCVAAHQATYTGGHTVRCRRLSQLESLTMLLNYCDCTKYLSPLLYMLLEYTYRNVHFGTQLSGHRSFKKGMGKIPQSLVTELA